MKTLSIGDTVIRIWDEDRLLVVELPDGRKVPARPHYTEDYRSAAQEHGYGDNVWEFCRDHEIGHVLLSWWATQGVSQTLKGVADKEDGSGSYWQHWWAEESAVLSFQRFAKYSGTSVFEIASRI